MKLAEFPSDALPHAQKEPPLPLKVAMFSKHEVQPRGGNIYNAALADYLERITRFRLFSVRGCSSGPARRLRYFLACAGLQAERSQNDVVIEDPVSLASRRPRHKGRSILLVHNLPSRRWQDRSFGKFLQYRWKQRLREVDLVVTVSPYYARLMAEHGAGQVVVIPNAFDSEELSPAATAAGPFLQHLGLDLRPIVYLGEPHCGKGVQRTRQLLATQAKESGWQLVSSGGGVPVAGVSHLKLSREDYLRLLQLAVVTVMLPDEIEGWPRLAHESVLMGTPLIANRSGGLLDLCETFGQTVCDHPHQLPGLVQHILATRPRVEPWAVEKARRYDTQRFARAWRDVLVGLS